jgi:CarD family transcriptional regulator
MNSETNLQFKVGDSAVYPSHGVGVIKRIDEKMIAGSKKSFYVMQVIDNGMTIMIPTDNTAGVGLRALISRDEIDDVYSILRDKSTKIDRTTWNRRYREYMDKIKTGSTKEIAEVLRNLFLLKHSKDLSFGEKKMFDTAKNLLVKEISLANQRKEEEVEAELVEALGNSAGASGTGSNATN